MLDLSKISGTHKSLRVAPDFAPCPGCASPVRRHEVKERCFWEASLERPTVMHLHFGYYICPWCPPGERAFSLIPPRYRTKCQYDRLTTQMMVELLVECNVSQIAAVKWAKKRFHLPHLSDVTVWYWSLEEAGRLSRDELHRKRLVKNFSGQFTVDELYDGGWCIIRVTDPLNNVEIAWRLLPGNPTQNDLRVLFLELKEEGFFPKIVSTDGSKLYPKVLAEVWPDALHQRCVFHFLMDLLKRLKGAFQEAYQTMPLPKKYARGKPRESEKKSRQKEKKKKKNRTFVRKSRWLVFKNPVSLSDSEARRLARAVHLCPALRPLLTLVRALLDLFASSTTQKHAQQKRRNILDNHTWKNKKTFKGVLDKLSDDALFSCLIAYLNFENAVKTSNHAERENRAHRQRQKGRYRYRCEHSIRALLIHLHHRPRPLDPKTKAPKPIVRLRLQQEKDPIAPTQDQQETEVKRAA